MPDIASLESSQYFWDWFGYISLGFVFFGVLGESIVEFTNLIRSPIWKSRVGKSSALALILGLGGELISSSKLSEINGQIIAILHTQAAEAIKLAGQLGVKVDNMNEFVERKGREADAAIALMDSKSRALLKAERDLAELQQKLADRKISDEQFKEVVSTLRPFSGQEYEVTAYWDSKESVAIAERINEALQLAGWKFLPMKEYRAMLGGVVGVLVWRHPEADEKTKKAADSLVAVLGKVGILAERRLQNPINNPKHNKLSLSVGAKR